MSDAAAAQRVLARLEAVARTHLGRQEALRRDDVLALSVAPDSLQRMTLVVEIENAFEVCLSDEDIARLVTVDDVVTLLVHKLGRAA